ncbi:37S ribosomal protein MRP1, mitochondrial [Candida viswanathii]|uniref:37S ribosomal protein MRP1, mitochondrial n=1 Tax=Candida viswanathii TaxID=5486 RepID=A0A367XYC6_9ASCO|nr:37S ribosomal protein MRP1, mitochondrial [Candida viswanathii]
MLRSTSAKTLVFRRYQTTSYTFQRIPTLEDIRTNGSNFSGLFSNKAVKQLWFDRGNELVKNLNQAMAQTNTVLDREYSFAALAELSMNNPELAEVYKNASSSTSLIYFFSSIRPLSKRQDKAIRRVGYEEMFKTPGDGFGNKPKDPALVDWINQSFGSVRELRNLIINSARGLKGDGTVWLVAESTMSEEFLNKSTFTNPMYHNLALVNTYNGTMISDGERSGQVKRMKDLLAKLQREEENNARRKDAYKARQEQEIKVEEEEGEKKAEVEDAKEKPTDTSDLQLGTVEKAEFDVAFLNKRLIPLLAIDASPRNYLIDYGVFGKQAYLENVWECIDWEVVSRRLPPRAKQVITM